MARRKIFNPINYESLSYGGYLVKDIDTGRDILIQVDYDFPSLAETFGWNGKITRKDLKISRGDKLGAEIYRAIQYLDDNEGKIVEDPGYFDEE